MSYDAASFMAGFALGRLIWQPPTLIGEVDTGLGWTANPAYLVYDEGADLGSNNYGHYTKRYDGWAIAIWEQRTPSNGLPVLFSTSADAAYTSVSWLYSGQDSGGHTWYIGTGAGEQGAGINSGGLMVYNGYLGDYRTAETLDLVSRLANVKWRYVPA